MNRPTIRSIVRLAVGASEPLVVGEDALVRCHKVPQVVVVQKVDVMQLLQREVNPGAPRGEGRDAAHGSRMLRITSALLAAAAVRAAALAQVFNHATHHRGQITAAFTKWGEAFPSLDLQGMGDGFTHYDPLSPGTRPVDDAAA